MKKLVPDPPSLFIRRDLPTEEALLRACENLRSALAAFERMPLLTSKNRTRAAFYQVEIALELVQVGMANYGGR